MKISEYISSPKVSISFEIFPPKKRDFAAEQEIAQEELERTMRVVEELVELNPSFISVTYGASGGSTGQNTCKISSYIESLGGTALAHLTCISSSRDKIADEIKEFRKSNIENVLCLRGDFPQNSSERPSSPNFSHAIDLVKSLRHSGFCLGGACYPEGHPESEHLRDDIRHLKEKVDAGLDFLTTQMFFDNNILYSYLAKIRSFGIAVPVVAGIMPVINAKQIKRICSLTGTTLPPRFRAIVDRFGDKNESMASAGIAYATEQIVDLIANGVDNIHIYTMNRPEIARAIMENIGGIIAD
jgi:methylenetetrahydrofolate reductase (NADPH)